MSEQAEEPQAAVPTLTIGIDAADVLNFASVVNQIPIIRRIDLANQTRADLENVTVRMLTSPDLIKPKTLHIAAIRAGQCHVLESIDLQADNAKLMELNEVIPLHMEINVACDGQILATTELGLEAVAYEQWPGERLMPQLLAAFSQPNTKATAGVQKNAATLLMQGHDKPLCGYQAKDRKSIALQIAAVYSAIAKMGISYANPPSGLASYGQRIRTPARIVQDSLATCLDTTLLMASVLESVGLRPLLLLSRDHAWLACWLTENALTETCTGDAQIIRKRIAAGEMLALETTYVCEGSHAKFSAAVSRGAERLDPELHDDFCFAIDVQRARHQKIKPLPAPGEHLEDAEPEAIIGIDRMEVEALVLPELADEAEPDVTADSKVTSERIEQWKTQLLDHSMRNRLLNCLPGKYTARFIHPEPGVIEDLLAAGKELQIDSLMDHVVTNDLRNDKLLGQYGDRSYRDELAVMALNRHHMVSLLDRSQTNTQITKLFRDAKSSEEETGSNTLYLCIGSLVWRPNGKSKDYQAPLLMLPMRLKRRSVGSSFRLVRHDDDPILNPTLLQVLFEQFAIKVPEIPAPHALPTDDSGVDVPRILSLVQMAVAEQPNMEVRPDIIQLGNFSFAKYLLWMDLNNKTEALLAHPLVNLMVRGDKDAAEALYKGEFIDRDDLDEKVDVGDLRLVTVADASQQVVIYESGRGRSFVVEGPPGTGKSETITNLIADQLGRGKHVLFVSEKMEALDVVHRRLCSVGLEPFLMVLHAAKASKKQVVDQYAKAVEAADARKPEGWDELRTRLRAKRNQLNDYVNVLHTPQPVGLTVHEAITIIARHPDWTPAKLSWAGIESVNAEQLAAMKQSARDMGVLAANFGGFDDNPLKSICITRYTPSWAEALLDSGRAYQQAFDDMHARMVPLATQFKISGLQWLPSDYDKLAGFFQTLLNPPAVSPELCAAGNRVKLSELLSEVVESVETRRSQGAALAEHWIDDTLKLDVSEFKLNWRAAMGKFWPFSWFAKFGLRGRLAPYAKSRKRPESGAVLGVLDQVETLQNADQSLSELKARVQPVLGDHYRALETDTQHLLKIKQWINTVDPALAKLVPNDPLRWRYIEALIKLTSQRYDQMAATGTMGQAFQAAITARNKHDQTLQAVCKTSGRRLEEVRREVPNQLQNWADETRGWAAGQKRLHSWCVWQRTRQEAMTAGLRPLVQALEAGGLAPEDFQAFFEFSFANWWMNQMVERTPVLQNFSRPLHEKVIEDFRALDAEFIEATRKEIFATLAGNVPRSDVNIPGSPMGFLRDQMTRQRNHRPVREILQRLGEQSQRLKPCMMMSPLTVAQYLDVADTHFDVVIFDEASQIRTCDAIGVIARAPQAIVVGDSKQLPPTSFFATGKDDDAADTEDHESILDQCASILPSQRLIWHYRSRNEELIAFSNDRYYDGQLITMPAPTTEKAVSLHKVPGVYDRGGSRTNRIEAEAVVQFIRQRALSPSTRRQSLGVVTFSATQQNLIQDLLDRACSTDPQLENAVKGRFNDDKQELFVKNLESVQGDQRDCIIFSICYGPTHKGIVYNDFGPVNRDGGQRRLNVAVTRAVEEVHVFTSMDPEDIKSAYLQDSGSGVGDLKRYLMFARDGVGALESYSSPTGRGVDSDFEAQIRNQLAAKGWDIHLQVGVSRFRIDLAVVDPRKPGRYLAGIECDGASYHSSASARDRDIVRQGVLERLGWKILRIWSTDWWTDAAAEVERIHHALLVLRDQPLDDAESEDFEFDPESMMSEGDVAEQIEATVPGGEDAKKDREPELLRADAVGERIHTKYPEYQDEPVRSLGVDPYDYRAGGMARALAENILQSSAPMMEEALFRKLLGAFGQKRLTAKATDTLRGYLKGISTSKEGGAMVYWNSREQAESYTDFRVGHARPVAEIPKVELANFAFELLGQAMQCKREDLAKAMSDMLGARRMSADIQSRLFSAMDLLVRQERAENAEESAIRHVVQDAN